MTGEGVAHAPLGVAGERACLPALDRAELVELALAVEKRRAALSAMARRVIRPAHAEVLAAKLAVDVRLGEAVAVALAELGVER